jgi:hypothetical protein
MALVRRIQGAAALKRDAQHTSLLVSAQPAVCAMRPAARSVRLWLAGLGALVSAVLAWALHLPQGNASAHRPAAGQHAPASTHSQFAAAAASGLETAWAAQLPAAALSATVPLVQDSDAEALDGLPAPLQAFARTRHAAALFGHDGTATQSYAGLRAQRRSWFALALRIGAVGAVQVLRWLAAQHQQDAAAAAVHFWNGCLEAGIEVPLTDGDQEALRAAMARSPMIPDAQAMASMAAHGLLPELARDDFRERVRTQPAVAQQLLSAMLQVSDAGQATALASLGDDDFLWRMGLRAGLNAHPLAHEGVLAALAARKDPQWLDRLATYTDTPPAPETIRLAAAWAEESLHGLQMQRLADLVAAGAFDPARGPLLEALLRHAAERDTAVELGARLGIARDAP